jgi:acyl carrier protein
MDRIELIMTVEELFEIRIPEEKYLKSPKSLIPGQEKI